ncbi:MAG: LEA type 2 family protein [Phycisphaerales bacterium]|nr:LEA type 2 family protein [Phycisphaerales bacterium]
MRTPILSALIAVLIISMALSTGCSNIKSPRFETVGVREIEHTQERTVYAFSVKATNPNREPIPLKQVAYTVSIDNQHVFSGVRSPETTLHTYGEHTFELPAVFEVPRSQLSGIIDYKLVGTTKYLKPGKLQEVLYESRISVPKAGFNLRGKIDVDDPDQD